MDIFLTGLKNGLIYLGVAVVILFICGFIKACKDPDVKAASKLGMSVTRFRLYRQLENEYLDYMAKHGSNSSESNRFFDKVIWPQVKNPNEWRRYQQYSSDLARQERYREYSKILPWMTLPKNKNN